MGRLTHTIKHNNYKTKIMQTRTKQAELLEICRKNIQPPTWLERNKFVIGIVAGIVVSTLVSFLK